MNTSADEPLSGNAFRSICDHVFWCDARPAENPGYRHGDVVFCKIDEVWRLFRNLRRTRKRIVLVTGEGDKAVHEDLWRRRPPHVAVWCGTNMEVQNDGAAHGLPLGLGNSGGQRTVSPDQIRRTAALGLPRTHLLYANFSTHSNEAVRGPLAAWLREPAQAWITSAEHDVAGGKKGYLTNLFTHRFVLCPPGNGEDTHRFWESLYCGAIPVIRSSPAMSHFRDLGALVLPDLCSVSPEMLREFSPPSSSGKPDCLQLAHWRERFARAGSSTRALPPLAPSEFARAWMREATALLRGRSTMILPTK